MSDAVSDMLRESRPAKKVADLPMVTAIVKCDTYPYYNVVLGQLGMDGGVKWGNNGSFRQESVIRVLPEAAFETQNRLLSQVEYSYRKQERQLRIDILKQHGVDFVAVP